MIEIFVLARYDGLFVCCGPRVTEYILSALLSLPCAFQMGDMTSCITATCEHILLIMSWGAGFRVCWLLMPGDCIGLARFICYASSLLSNKRKVVHIYGGRLCIFRLIWPLSITHAIMVRYSSAAFVVSCDQDSQRWFNDRGVPVVTYFIYTHCLW